MADTSGNSRISRPKHVSTHQQSANNKLYLEIAIGIIIILIIIYALVPSQPVYNLSSNQSVNLGVSQAANFRTPDGKMSSLYLLTSQNTSAVFLLSPSPVLSSMIQEFTLPKNSYVNVSTTGGSTANLQVKLISSGPKSATVVLTVIPSSFGVRTSSGITLVNSTLVANSNAKNSSVVTTVATTTTISNSSKNSTSTITSISTTTVSNTSSSNPQVMQILNSTTIGKLMNNYASLYAKDGACTAPLYNSTYQQYLHVLPPAPSSFQNASLGIPTALNTNITSTGANAFSVTYIAVTPKVSFGGPLLNVQVNTATSVLGNIIYKGAWKTLNFTLINSTYTFEAKINNACAAFIP